MSETLDPREVRRGCRRFLTGHYALTARQELEQLAEWTDSALERDVYGAGPALAELEAEVAALLGKEAAVFMPSGTMAQQIALRIWAERTGRRAVAFHPTCHLEIWEQDAYRVLHGLRGVLVGSPSQPMTRADLDSLRQPVGALLIELPQREIGGQLPGWEELQAQCAWARERGAALHMDGARLWECRPFYGRAYAEIAAPFDTVYVSFYKTLGGLAGAALAGPADLIGEARVWQRRHGGNLVRMFPYALSARQALATRLGRVDSYVAHAQALAADLTTIPQLEVSPQPPHVNMFHLFVRGERAALERALLDVAREAGVWLFHPLQPTRVPGTWAAELSFGDASLDVPPAEAAGLVREAVRRATA